MALYSLTQFISVLILYTVSSGLAAQSGPMALRSVAGSPAGPALDGVASNPALLPSSCVAWMGPRPQVARREAQHLAHSRSTKQGPLSCADVSCLPCGSTRETEAEPWQGRRQMWDGVRVAAPFPRMHLFPCSSWPRPWPYLSHPAQRVSPCSALSTRSSPPWKGGDPMGQRRSRTSLCPCVPQEL